MNPPGSRAYESVKLTEQLYQALEQELADLSEDVMLSLEGRLSEVLANIRSTMNSRTLLCGLPAEVLAAILQEIPMLSASQYSQLVPFWDPRIGDSSLLIPVSMTCRRLRAIALSLPDNSWSHIETTKHAAISSLLRRSEGKKISIAVRNERHSTNALRAIHHTVAPRLRELFLLDISFTLMQSVWPVVNRAHPRLRTLACCGSDPLSRDWESRDLTLSPHQFPHLRHFVLVGVTFKPIKSPLSSLTHIVLAKIMMTDLHRKVVRLLTTCPKLQKLVLSKLTGSNVPDQPRRHRFLFLKQVVLHELNANVLRFYLDVFTFGAKEASLQVVNEWVSPGEFAHEHVLANRIDCAEFLAISTLAASCEDGSFPKWSVTLSDAKKAVRFSTTVDLLRVSPYLTPMTWIERILADKPRLSNVCELWLVKTSTELAPFRPMLTSVLSTLSELHTLVLVTADAGQTKEAVSPDISGLPSYPGANLFHLPRLKTLRLIHYVSPGAAHGGCSNMSQLPFTGDFVPRKLDLARLCRQLESREYQYFEHLVLQTTPHFVVDKGELKRLEPFFKSVVAHPITRLPKMPLPQSCVEPDYGPGGSCAWTRSLG